MVLQLCRKYFECTGIMRPQVCNLLSSSLGRQERYLLFATRWGPIGIIMFIEVVDDSGKGQLKQQSSEEG